MIGIGVIGYGYWGPNLTRNFAEVPEARLVLVSDLQQERLTLAQRRHPSVETTRDLRKLIEDPRVDAVVIATPVATHYELAMRALEAGKHVLIEKPMTASCDAAARLIEEAKRRQLVLMVDHTHVHTAAVRKIEELIAGHALGNIYYYDAVRANLGLFQPDVNVLWDLAVHDLSIVDHVLPWKPVAVSAVGMSHVPGAPENIAYLTLFFEGRLIAHVHANWLAPIKIRKTLIGGSRRMIVYDDLEPSEKLKVYDRGITVDGDPDAAGATPIGYRSGDVFTPSLDPTEALRIAVLDFVRCMENGTPPITDGEAGLRVVRLLEAASQSLAEQGRPVEIEDSRAMAR